MTFGVFFLCLLIGFVVGYGISIFALPFYYPMFPPGLIIGVLLLGLVVSAAFHITGGILCLRRKYWRVCLASASFAVFLSVFFLVWEIEGLSFSDFIYAGWITLVVLVAAVVAIVFISLRKKEWQEFWDSVDDKVSYDG